MKSFSIPKIISARNFGIKHPNYIFIRYLNYGDTQPMPPEHYVTAYIKEYLNVYDFTEQMIDYVTSYGTKSGIGIKYKDL
jgi:hypothetical protein